MKIMTKTLVEPKRESIKVTVHSLLKSQIVSQTVIKNGCMGELNECDVMHCI